VVYRKQKNSLHPGPHAQDIQPALHGDSYSYSVEKFWRVIRAAVDHLLAPIRLDANSRFKELVCRLCPGDDHRAEEE
jgi:hypothetical protein